MNRTEFIGTNLYYSREFVEDMRNDYDQEIERLKTELEVSKNNEETRRLEMLDITKRLGLDEETLFDDVKDKAERLNNIFNSLNDYLVEHLTYDMDWAYHLGIRETYKFLQTLKGE